jgi:ABC-type transporter Mla MlaB component
VVIGGPIAPADVPGLCNRVLDALERSNAHRVVCDVSALGDPDAAAVDALARLHLAAGRLARRLELRRAPHELRDLVVLMGLGEVLACRATPRAGAEARRAGTPTPYRGRS